VELIERLYALNETKEQIEVRGESVILKKTYGTIAFEYWVEDLVKLASDVYEELHRLKLAEERHRREFQFELDCRIDERIAACRKGKVDPKIAELAGEEDALKQHRRMLQEVRERSKQQMTRRLRYARHVLANLSNECRIQVLDEAIKEGILQSYDKGILDNIFMFPEKFYKIVERMAKQQ
jgi:hypothetical protein